jgi:threonylcarbamoyladenosine tRNA methylthiotransferase MtaB
MDETTKKVAFYTLGCKLNFSETSTIARQFEEHGFTRVSSDSEADIYVINTCSVTDHADKKCRQAIRKFIHKSPNAYIAVVGCYAQLNPEEISKIEGVDLVLGSSEKYNIPLKIDKGLRKASAKIYSCDIDVVTDFFPAYSTGDRTRSFLKVQDGCDYHCSYCTIPLARGRSRNMPIDNIVKQAKEIASRGTKEIILTGVNTGDFGKSTNESFLDLLAELEKVDGIERYRISSIEPNLITNEIIRFVAESKKFLPHFHIPLQSGSNRILGLMKRRYSTELFAEKLKEIRKTIPNAFIGIDLIVGFPGETEIDFNESYEFINNQNPAFIHIFPYSERPNTPAANYEKKVKYIEIKQRVEKLSELNSNLHLKFLNQNIGKVELVLFESSRKGESMFGFTQNYIKVETKYNKQLIGKIVAVKMVGMNPNGNMSIELIA